MKRIIRSGLRKLGYELLHTSSDPVLTEIRKLHDSLRLSSNDRLIWADSLAKPAAHAAVRDMLEVHQINLVLDVGANRGQFAQQARQLGYRGELLSFEPMTQCHAALEALFRDDPKWQLIKCACGASPGTAQLNVFHDDTFSSLHAANTKARDRFGDMVTKALTEDVEVCRLDSIASLKNLGPQHRVLLKTDTQGHDLEVLRGSEGIWKNVVAIVAEASFDPLYENAPDFFAIQSFLAERSFFLSGIFPISHHAQNLRLIEADCIFTSQPSAR